MDSSILHKDSCSPGRSYQLAKNIGIKYDNEKDIINSIIVKLAKYITSQSAIRITIDTDLCSPERATIALPFEAGEDIFVKNFAEMIYHKMMGYYMSADPKTSHYGLSHTVIESQEFTSLLRRELESLCTQCQNRNDMAARLIRNIDFRSNEVPPTGDNYMQETLKRGIDIHVGFRIIAFGGDIHTKNIFIPIQGGHEIISRVYYNLEQMLHHNFVSYDESGDGYLNITDTLIFKETASLLKRAKEKENTRKKLVNNLKFTTVFTEIPEQLYGANIGDALYDTINKIQEEKLRRNSDYSRELFATYMIRATEMTSSSLEGNIADIEMTKGRTYVPARDTTSSSSLEEGVKVLAEKKVPVPKKVAVEAKKAITKTASRLKMQKDSFQEL